MERPVQPDNPANAAPKFPDQDADTSGDQSDSTMREVEENTKAGTAFGVEIEATDPTNDDLLIHTLGGDDADSFGINRNNGQLKTKDALNYEEKDTYSLTITATDPSGATDTIAVTINVTDANDDAVVTGDDTIDDYPENGTDPVASYSATDQDGDAIVWSVDNDTFEISEDGVLTFASPPDYEEGIQPHGYGQGYRRCEEGYRQYRRHERAWDGEAQQAAAASHQGPYGHLHGTGRGRRH